MIAMVRRSLNKFKLLHDKYNLFVPPGKIGSDHYILTQLKDDINPIQIITDFDDEIENDYPIIMFDDAIYSSVHICEFYDELTYKFYDELTYERNVTNKFYALVAVLSSRDVEFLTGHGFVNVDIIADITIPELMVENLFDDYDFEYFYDTFGCETGKVLPLFFEHKVANEFGSYQFYHHLAKKPIDRSVIDVITRADIDLLVEELRKK